MERSATTEVWHTSGQAEYNAPMRTEHDTMGAVQVPDDAYYGAQTQRADE